MDSDDRTRDQHLESDPERSQSPRPDGAQPNRELPESTQTVRTDVLGQMEARVGDAAPGFVMQGEEDRVHKSPSPPIRTRVRPGCGGAAGTLGVIVLALLLSTVDVLTG